LTREDVGDPSARLDLTVRAVEWIEEQQKADREQVARGVDQLEKVGLLARELATRTEALENERGQVRALGSRVVALEDTSASLREAAADIKQSLESLHKQAEHQVLLRSTEMEHDRRGVAEIAQQANDLRRQQEALQSRIQVISEELRRDRASADQIPSSLDGLSRQIASLVSRAQQLEDYRRRTDDQAATLSQNDEQARADIAKLDNWQRLADVRWNRLSNELQEQAQVAKHQLDEQSKPVQQVGRLVKQVQEETAGVAALLQDLRKRVDDQFVAQEKVAGQIGVLREGLARIDQTLESQRRRSDEFAASDFRLDEALQRAAAVSVDLGKRLEILDTRIEGVASQVRIVESQRQRDEQGLTTLQQQVRELRLSFAEDLAATREKCAADVHLLNQRVAAIVQVALREREKTLAASQQEVESWAGLVRDDRHSTEIADAASAEKRRGAQPV
jgi:chromosome segregation ATPase